MHMPVTHLSAHATPGPPAPITCQSRNHAGNCAATLQQLSYIQEESLQERDCAAEIAGAGRPDCLSYTSDHLFLHT